MKTDRNLLVVLAVVLAFFAFWRVFAYRTSHGQKNPAIVENVQQIVADKSAELFKEKPHTSAQEMPAHEDYTKTQTQIPTTVFPTTRTTNNDNISANSQNSSAANSVGTTNMNQSVAKTTHPTHYSSVGTNLSTDKNNTSATFSRNASTPDVQEQILQERSANLSSFLIPDKEAQKKLDANFKDLSAAVARAVQAALKPKSKKDANIEKYLHKGNSAETTAAADPFQEMLAQVANQKKIIVENVTEAFGKPAGQRAGQLMDNFQKDLTTEVSKTDQTPQAMAQNIQKIAQNYEQKFDQMNRQNQYDLYVKELKAQYADQLKSLQELYPDQDQLNKEFTRISNEALKKELALSAPDMSPEEYTKARYDIQYKMHQEMEAAIKKAGTSLNGLNQYDNDRAKDILKDLEEKEKAGLIASLPRKESEEHANALSEMLLGQQSERLSQLEQAYGPQAIAEFKPIFENYYKEMMKTTQEPMTVSQRFETQENLRKEYSRRILEMQREKILQMDNLSPEQKEESVQKIDQAINDLLKM